jgi:hypothetical protein
MTKTFIDFLSETTVPEEYRDIPERWYHHSKVDYDTQNKIANAMTHGHFTHFPLETGDDADPDVIEHLNKHGWDVKDYQKGIAHRKIQVGNPEKGIPMREKVVEKKIGSILDETDAPKEVKTAFINQRSSSNKENPLHVVISTSPLAIMGMTTGTSWRDQSCMNYPGGAYCHKLKDDSEHGTHVAYLVHQNDINAFRHGEPDNPLARIVLKPHHAEDPETGERDTIFRPEDHTYGTNSTAFSRAVSAWSTKAYPALKDVAYEKNEDVYDDTGNNAYESIDEDTIKDNLDKDRTIVRKGGTGLDHHVIDAGVNHLQDILDTKTDHGKYRAIRNLSRIGNLSTQHVAKLHKIANELPGSARTDAIDELAINHGDKFSTSNIKEYYDRKQNMPDKMVASTKLPDEILDKLPLSQYEFVRNSKIKPHHIDKIVDAYNNGESGSSSVLSHFKDKLNSEHIDKLIHSAANTKFVTNTGVDWNKMNMIISTVADNPNFSRSHHQKILDLYNNDIKENRPLVLRNLIAKSKHTKASDILGKTSQDLDMLMGSNHLSEDDQKTVKNELMNRAMTHVHKKVSQWGSHMPFLGHIAGMKSTMPGALVPSRNMLPESISKHLTDTDYHELASKHFDMRFENPEHSNKYLNAIWDHANDIDGIINDHMEHKMNSQDEYDPDDDHELNKMKDELHKSIETYTSNIENHISNHVEDDDERLKSRKEHSNTDHRINGVGRYSLSYLDNADHNNNEDVQNIDEKLHKLKANDNDY